MITLFLVIANLIFVFGTILTIQNHYKDYIAKLNRYNEKLNLMLISRHAYEYSDADVRIELAGGLDKSKKYPQDKVEEIINTLVKKEKKVENESTANYLQDTTFN